MRYVFTLPEHRQSAVVAVSAFDGVHVRHQRLLAEAVTIARQLGVASVALLPWPPMVAEPGATSDQARDGLLTTLDERIALLARMAPEARQVVLAADAAQPWSPASLAERIMNGWDVRGLVIDSSADETLCGMQLADVAHQRGAAVTLLSDETSVAPLGAQIRDALSKGRVAEAAQQLTYEYALSAEVVGGDRRGRLLGFPTANLRVDANKLLPANGIYAVRVGLPGDPDATRPAVASVGVRPTFGDHNARLVEVHLLDLSMDLYGVRITTTFVEWLRAEERFDSVEALIRQMLEDVAQARLRLGNIHQASESDEGPRRPQLMHLGDAHP
ncbi:MAG TPA: riboflavin kinase [Ktedonobacterales bacterium]|nr:riboflavin kinase [Ktedonobacterales bacterium]